MASNSKRPRKLKKRLLAGGVIGAVVALAVWLAGLLPGLGLGLGAGGKGPGSGKTAEEKSPQKPKPKDTTMDGRVIVVQIDGVGLRREQKRDGESELHKVTIAEIIQLAGQIPGDDNGAKVHIYFRGTGLRATDRQLQDELRKANIKFERFTPDFR